MSTIQNEHIHHRHPLFPRDLAENPADFSKADIICRIGPAVYGAYRVDRIDALAKILFGIIPRPSPREVYQDVVPVCDSGVINETVECTDYIGVSRTTSRGGEAPGPLKGTGYDRWEHQGPR